ncbi:helicase superfamily 1/2 ATP-binding domain protein [Vibrio phage 1.060.A._10N.261.48.B5]|nr:helicase superfamily 1/2 ATP-binding domain protein [Vibrio phage 1.060.A._10N.261.48.B5]
MSSFKVPEFNFKFNENFEAYDYQKETFHKVMGHIRSTNDPAYIYASVSSGKSLLIAMIAKHFQNVNEAAESQGFTSNHQVLMIVRTGELVRQNSDEAWSIGCKNSIWCSGLISKANRRKPAYPVIMGSEKSVYNSLGDELAHIRPTVLLLDEGHTFDYNNEDSVLYKTVQELKSRNKNLKIIALTGSPWRGRRKILDGDFWKKELISIDRQYLTDRGFVMPTVFGFGTGDAHYETYLDYKPEEEGDVDLTKKELAAMESVILKEGTRTQQIMLDVMKQMQNRNCALITLSGHKHCVEAAKYLPEGSYAIITEKTSTMERLDIKERCNRGELKYVLQIGVWTIGVSIPRIDTIVIMRLIGSMTMYEQLVGRGVRKLKKPDIDAGIVKNECLILDYTDTSAVMAYLFSSDELDRAENSRAKANDEDMISCPKCGYENSPRARRCSNVLDSGRCDFFFSSKICEDLRGAHTGILIKKGCGTENDPSSKVCRKCNEFMKDPNESLLNTAYSKDDLINVTGFNFGLTRDESKVLVTYQLANGKRPRELFDLSRKEKWARTTWVKFVNEHVDNAFTKKALISCRNPKMAMQYAKEVKTPLQVTHRVNDKKFDIIARKVFE